MFERLTPEARRIVTCGVEIAQQLEHDFLGTEHLLIALAGTGPNIATRALIASGFDPARAGGSGEDRRFVPGGIRRG